MKTFDVLDPTASLFGKKLLEASAGTGKTFAIEHLFVRLLLEGQTPLHVEQILAITFTRAAARDLNLRIHENLKKAWESLKEEKSSWPYLETHKGSIEAQRKLEKALIDFDQAQIFTIHGFCQRALSEFPLEANSSAQDAHSELTLQKTVLPVLLDFLEKQTILCSEQLAFLPKVEKLATDLLNAPTSVEDGDVSKDFASFKEAITSYPGGDLTREFEAYFSSFKISGFSAERLQEQVATLEKLFVDAQEKDFQRLLYDGGDLFDFLEPSNLKKGKTVSSELLNWCLAKIKPVVKTATDSCQLFRRLCFFWRKTFEQLMEEKSLFSPDFLLQKMRSALEKKPFLEALQGKYLAVIIDEFQDTDSIQWDIFQKLFIDQKSCALYLVGDPKQSIYRFRKADLYTYFAAKDLLGHEAHYSLATNFRSTPPLIHALNDLFSDEWGHSWLYLPKVSRKVPYSPVKAGLSQSWDPQDGKGSLQFFQAQDPLAYVAAEIARLRPFVKGYGSFAILVRSRYEAQLIERYLTEHSFPCWSKNGSSLGETLALRAVEELFDAIYHPRDPSAIKSFLTGPFMGLSFAEATKQDRELPELFEWKAILEKEGLASFFKAFIKTIDIQETGAAFYSDFLQIIEQLLPLPACNLHTIKRAFREWEAADPQEDLRAKRRIENDEEAIQILTIHASKGLEFEIVFALGVGTSLKRSGDEKEEEEAEMLRLLYVALTRAKFRLYIPYSEGKLRAGSESCLDLFWKRQKLDVKPLDWLLSKNGQIQYEVVSFLPSPSRTDPEALAKSAVANSFTPAFAAPRRIYSYSMLAQGVGTPMPPITSDEKNIHTMPRGALVGELLHGIYERVFTQRQEIEKIVAEELHLTELGQWLPSVIAMVQKSVQRPLIEGLCLSQLDATCCKAEVEFLYGIFPHFYKGFIDLVFIWQGKLYFLDWKTNWLGDRDEAYSKEHLYKAMDEGDYWLQASIYASALKRAFPSLELGGAIYCFLRGVQNLETGGVIHFQPKEFSGA